MSEKTFLFTYHYNGENWEVPIVAATQEEAQERIKRIAYATYTGELQASFKVPFT